MGLVLGTHLSAQVLTTNVLPFPGYKVEITLDGLNQIHRFRITTEDSCNATNVLLLNKTNFDDWIGGRKYYGLIQMGPHLSVITEATGTGIGQYSIHEYEIRKNVRLLQSTQMYEWVSGVAGVTYTNTAKPSFTFEHDTNDIWNPFIRKTD